MGQEFSWMQRVYPTACLGFGPLHVLPILRKSCQNARDPKLYWYRQESQKCTPDNKSGGKPYKTHETDGLR